MTKTITAKPLVVADPYDYSFALESTALLIIDMQADF